MDLWYILLVISIYLQLAHSWFLEHIPFDIASNATEAPRAYPIPKQYGVRISDGGILGHSEPSSLAPINVSTLSFDLFSTTNASRSAQTVMTLSNDPSVLESAVDEFERLIQPFFADDPELVAQAMYQPIPSAVFQHMTDSPIKLTDGPIFVFFLSFLWTDPSRDLYYKSELQEIHKRVEQKAAELGGLRQWKYWNYAAGWQDVYRDYGDDVYDRLTNVVDVYDPDRIFFWLQGKSFDFL